jgi:hypothetical protein
MKKLKAEHDAANGIGPKVVEIPKKAEAPKKAAMQLGDKPPPGMGMMEEMSTFIVWSCVN